MICPKCKNKIKYGLDNCPCCNHNISFSTNIRTGDEKQVIDEIKKGKNLLGKAFIISGIVSVLILFLIIGFFPVSNLLNIFSILKYSRLILTIFQVIGAIGFVIFLVFKFKNNSKKIVNVLGIISLVFFIFPFFIKPLIKIDDDFFGKDYTKEKYIKIGAEKIPSVYSVVGKRSILMSINEERQFSEDLNTSLDLIGIIYVRLTQEDREIYKKELINLGFIEKEVYETSERVYKKMLLKNNIKDNSFYIVVIEDRSIVYSTSEGMYEEVLDFK